jgi:hypothetical protein
VGPSNTALCSRTVDPGLSNALSIFVQKRSKDDLSEPLPATIGRALEFKRRIWRLQEAIDAPANTSGIKMLGWFNNRSAKNETGPPTASDGPYDVGEFAIKHRLSVFEARRILREAGQSREEADVAAATAKLRGLEGQIG